MVTIIKQLAGLINDAHDSLNSIIRIFFPSMNDKDMHFWIIGIFGIIFYFVVNMAFKRLAKLSVELISLVYTVTVLLVVVFAIEIQQKITNRGAMEFEDIVAGMKGFLVLFTVYGLFKLAIYGIKLIISRYFPKTEEQ